MHVLGSESLHFGHRVPADDVEGELWMVHGGGFFRLQKTYKLPSVFTGDLHWFKYEALGTWVSGFLLLVVLYYFTGGVLMLDARVAETGGDLRELLVAYVSQPEFLVRSGGE